MGKSVNPKCEPTCVISFWWTFRHGDQWSEWILSEMKVNGVNEFDWDESEWSARIWVRWMEWTDLSEMRVNESERIWVRWKRMERKTLMRNVESIVDENPSLQLIFDVLRWFPCKSVLSMGHIVTERWKQRCIYHENLLSDFSVPSVNILCRLDFF